MRRVTLSITRSPICSDRTTNFKASSPHTGRSLRKAPRSRSGAPTISIRFKPRRTSCVSSATRKTCGVRLTDSVRRSCLRHPKRRSNRLQSRHRGLLTQSGCPVRSSPTCRQRSPCWRRRRRNDCRVRNSCYLLDGRARHDEYLAMVQTQMIFGPVHQPAAQGGNTSPSDVGDAIRWLDMGASDRAMQSVTRAIDSLDAGG